MGAAISTILGFDISQSAPLDVRATVADQAARLALKYPYKGLVTRQADTGVSYRYITTTPIDGSLPTNLVGDWEFVPTVFSAAGAPAGSKGVINDIYIDETGFILYKKTGVATWTSMFSISGSKIYVGIGVPGGGLGVNGDLYQQSNGDVYYKAAGAWGLQFNLRGTNGTSDKFATTSSDSINVGTVIAPLSITIGVGLSWTVGQNMLLASRATPTKNIQGTVVSYNSGTGAVVLNPITPAGAAGAVTDWDVNVNGAAGPIGKAFIHVEADINFNDAKVTAVVAGVWTKANPWSASVANDTRSSFISPVALSGSMSGNSIAYDGTSWINNGRWLGANGASVKGDKGDKGNDGNPGLNGILPYAALYHTGTYTGLGLGIYQVLNLGGGTALTIGFAPAGSILVLTVSGSAYGGQTLSTAEGMHIVYRQSVIDTLSISDNGILGLTLVSNGVTWDCVGEINDLSAFLSVIKPITAPGGSTVDLRFDPATYTTKSFPSFTFAASKYTVPYLQFAFGAFKSGGGDFDLSASIEYSGDGVTFFQLKKTTYRFQQNNVHYNTIAYVDNEIGWNETRYYRLTLFAAGGFQPSFAYDRQSHGVLRYL